MLEVCVKRFFILLLFCMLGRSDHLRQILKGIKILSSFTQKKQRKNTKRHKEIKQHAHKMKTHKRKP